MSQAAPQSATIVKSGYLWKKGIGVLGQTYKERLFELKLTGKIDYFEIGFDKTKTLKGTILLSKSTKIKRRTDTPSNEHKFILQTQERLWYLWCRHPQNAKQEADEWCSLISNMINASNKSHIKTSTTNNEPNTDITSISATDEALASTEDLSLHDMIQSNPINPNQPMNPFYGAPKAEEPQTSYYASLKPNANNPDPIAIASAPPLDEHHLESKVESMDLAQRNPDNVQFKISETVSLKSLLFKTWMSFNPQHGYLSAVTHSPMINERFYFECIDAIHDIYTIKTASGVYLSADLHTKLKFVPKIYGVDEQWIVKYHHINKISITSKYYGTHFGIDANGLFHYKYPDITDIVLFEVSPPLILSRTQRDKAIHMHWDQPIVPHAPPSANNAIRWPQLVSGSAIALCCGSTGDGSYVGVENKASKVVFTQYSTYQSFDGEPLARSIFYVTQNAPFQLFAFKSGLNNKYLSPSDTTCGRIRFVDKLTEKEYFHIVWHEFNIISLVSWNGTIVKVKQLKNKVLYHEGYEDMLSQSCVFEIKCKNRMHNKGMKIPYVQLPVRTINGEIKRDIWLKGHSPNIGYLAFRSKPYRYEAVSKIMGRWETLRFKHDVECSNSDICIVSLFTVNGMMIMCDAKAQIAIVKQEDVRDKEGGRWKVYFHSYSLISIQNKKYKGWMTLKKDKITNVYVLAMLNPSCDAVGRPMVDIKCATQYKNVFCQFELCPIANCKDFQKANDNELYTQNTSNVTFSM